MPLSLDSWELFSRETREDNFDELKGGAVSWAAGADAMQLSLVKATVHLGASHGVVGTSENGAAIYVSQPAWELFCHKRLCTVTPKMLTSPADHRLQLYTKGRVVIRNVRYIRCPLTCVHMYLWMRGSL